MELEYGLSVVDVFENLESITFIFEEITHDLAEEGVIYPTIIEYIKPTYIDSRGLLNAKAVPQTKYVEGIMYSGTSLMKKNSFLANLSRSGILAVLSSAIGVSTGHTAVVTTAEVIVSNIASAIKSGLPNTSTVIADVYTQTKTTNRSGQVGIVAWNGTVAWKPTYIVEKFDYYSYVQGRIYYSNKPARPYTTNNVLYKTFMNTYFNSTQESFRSRALTYYNKGEIYINGKIYKM